MLLVSFDMRFDLQYSTMACQAEYEDETVFAAEAYGKMQTVCPCLEKEQTFYSCEFH